ncbi:TetR/AcrR family transcriptional regulator [Kutzneria sp. NPDC052558]|uniref:TetR/AcrR family transcriptional regulator n=1 Tax=Kutzneria sp. NPDC052558 TaxID=3364121 RepID=UPI0037C75A7E
MDPAPRTRTRRRTGSYQAADGKRAAIVEAATTLFAQDGFHETSIARVAAEAGTSQTGLLHHFNGKDALLLAVLHHKDIDWRSRFSDAKLGVRVLLGHVLDVLADEMKQPGITRLFMTTAAAAATPNHPAAEYFRQRYQRMAENNAAAVRASIAAGDLRPDVDADDLGRTLVAATDGLKVQWLLSPDFDLVAACRTCFDDLLRGIAADGRGMDG